MSLENDKTASPAFLCDGLGQLVSVKALEQLVGAGVVLNKWTNSLGSSYELCIETSHLLRKLPLVQRRDRWRFPRGQPHRGRYEAAEGIQGISPNRGLHLQLQCGVKAYKDMELEDFLVNPSSVRIEVLFMGTRGGD